MKDEQAQEVYTQLIGTPLFRSFQPADLLGLIKESSLQVYAESSTVIREGEYSPDFYIVVAGSVNVSVKEEKDVYICTIGEGEFFGEAGIFAKVKRTANIEAAENTSVLKVHRDTFLGHIKKNPTAGMKILMIIIYSLLKKLRTANQELAFERKFDIEQEDIDEIIRGIVES
jgi:CRP/FNR family transcriptional regulator, cyclic AMP receptor protein